MTTIPQIARRVGCAALLTVLAHAPARADACDRHTTTTGWVACRAHETRDARLCASIADVTLQHFCTEAAGQGGCEDVHDPTMNRLCWIHAEIR